jgi:hypothetical protein
MVVISFMIQAPGGICVAKAVYKATKSDRKIAHVNTPLDKFPIFELLTLTYFGNKNGATTISKVTLSITTFS